MYGVDCLLPMASCRTLNTSLHIRKISVRSRKLRSSNETSSTADINLLSTASGSPASPRRIRVLGPRTVRNPLQTSTEAPMESSIPNTHDLSSAQVFSKLERLVESVVIQLWNRDGSHPNPNSPELLKTKRCALWYTRKFTPSRLDGGHRHERPVVALAAVFITFKAADFIPGTGRVKMNQLLEAYERASGLILTEQETDRLIDQICKTEMDIMSLTDFNFNPVQ